jgi:hypothetical protein
VQTARVAGAVAALLLAEARYETKKRPWRPWRQFARQGLVVTVITARIWS